MVERGPSAEGTSDEGQGRAGRSIARLRMRCCLYSPHMYSCIARDGALTMLSPLRTIAGDWFTDSYHLLFDPDLASLHIVLRPSLRSTLRSLFCRLLMLACYLMSEDKRSISMFL